MKTIIPKICVLCICLAVIFTATAAMGQAIYQAEESETITAASPDGTQSVTVVLPRRAIQPTEVALIVNSQDPQSVNTAAYYRQVRNIPAANVIEVSFPAGSTSINRAGFQPPESPGGCGCRRAARYSGAGHYLDRTLEGQRERHRQRHVHHQCLCPRVPPGLLQRHFPGVRSDAGNPLLQYGFGASAQ